MPTLTAHVTDDFIDEIDSIAVELERPRDWVIQDALREYVSRHYLEAQRWRETQDAIDAAERGEVVPAEEDFRSDLEGIKEVCRWTDGYWDFGPGMQRKWNEIQNTSKDIQLLSNYLLIQYKARVWNRGPAGDETVVTSVDTQIRP